MKYTLLGFLLAIFIGAATAVWAVTGTLTYNINAGGAAPTPPAQASVAGFTTCILCLDFTAATGGVWTSNGASGAAFQPPGVNTAQTNTYIDCAMSSGQSSAFLFFLGSAANSTFPCPSITTDGGTQVLQQTMLAISGENHNTLTTYCGAYCLEGWTGWGILPPTAEYMELTFKVPVAASNCWVETFWTGGFGGIPDSVHNFLEFDAWEMNGTNCVTDASAQCSGWHDWAAATPGTGDGDYGNAPNWCGSFPPTGNPHAESNYVKLGWRVTTDGATIYKCIWINDVFQNCIAGGPKYSWQLTDTYSRWQTILSLAGGVNITGTITGYMKSFNIWACGNWKTIACRTSSANPGGY